MYGVYKFYLDDKLIHEEKNALTVAGRSIIVKSLLGIIPSFANSIAYGLGNSANILSASTNLITNNSLQFETGRTRVIASSISLENGNDILIYSGTIDDTFQSEIREVGLYPSILADASLGIDGSLIFNFDNVANFIKLGTASGSNLVTSTYARIGSDLFRVPSTSSANNYLQYSTTDGSFSYIDKYTSQDLFKLAGYNTNSASCNIFFRFFTNDTSYYDVKFRSPTSSGYFVSEIEKGQAVITGNPSWGSINYVRIWQQEISDIYLDGLKLDIGSYFIDSNYGMISRAVLAQPIRKPPSIPITIEYSLALGFNYGVA